MKCLPLILVLFFISCSTEKKSRDAREYEADDLLSIYEPKWFSASEKHSLRDSEGRVQPHLFFDISPEFTEKEQLANIVVTTPENSHLSYGVDLISGQRYYAHSYCNQTDVWNQKSGTFGRPYFSLAYMPRVLDQMGEPQKVIVFGGGDRLRTSIDHHFVRVRIIGAYVEENCQELNCLGKDNWLSRLVFIAVDPKESRFSEITDIESFEKVESWDKLQATLQNMDGRNYSVDRNYPFIRVRRLIPYKEAIQLFRKRSAFLSDEEIKKIQKGCHTLYDKFWEDVGKDRDEDKVAKTQEELKKKVKIIEDLQEKKLPTGKMARFRKFIKKYFTNAATCEKFVYHGNINQNAEHFWFHSYMGMYIRLHKEGYYFDCRRKVWSENLINVNGDPVHFLPDEIDFCSTKDLDMALDYMPNHLNGMKGVLGNYYRFIDYDTHEFGTHRKTYSWVKMSTRKYECRPDPNTVIYDKINVIPEDASWKKWEVIDVADELKIIY